MPSFVGSSEQVLEQPGAGGDAVDFLGFSLVGRALRTFVQFVRDERAVSSNRRRIANELSTYTDMELAELGFSRGDIPAVAAGTYRR